MAAVCNIVAVMTFVATIFGHECNDYHLSPSDQSLVDMMKHYLHTSRKEGCSGKQEIYQDLGVTYIRWGRKSCPDAAELVYTGQAGGNNVSNKGGGTNYLCLPNDPDNGPTLQGDNDGMFGAEYEVSGRKSLISPNDFQDQEVPCAVCRRKWKSSLILVPGRKSCNSGWHLEYKGLLMTEHVVHNSKDYICVDADAETLDKPTSNQNGALFFAVKTKCGSLRCLPYTDAAEVNCAVCTK